MTDLQLYVPAGGDAERRLRALLAREGFRLHQPAGEEVTVQVVDLEDGPESLVRNARERIEELERTVLELRNLDTAKSVFLTNVSHELRTPLTAIITYGEVLRDGLLGEVNERQQQALTSLTVSGRQLLGMIEEILTYAKANARASQFRPSEVRLEEVIGEVHELVASLIREKSLGWVPDIDARAATVWGDPDKLSHVFRNLLGNAIEFTDAGGEVRIEARPAAEREGWIEVVVADTGIGIAPEHHEMIFREFTQVDSSRARRHHGTGLGLAIARTFIRLHGGRIWVDSALGEGSRFHLLLPAHEAATREEEA